MSGLFLVFRVCGGPTGVQVPRDGQHPIPISQGDAPVDAGVNGLEFRGGQRTGGTPRDFAMGVAFCANNPTPFEYSGTCHLRQNLIRWACQPARGPQHKMPVVGHERVGQNPAGIPLPSLGEDLLEGIVVLRFVEHGDRALPRFKE